ncbi:MAG: hypothetical protein JJ926_09565 [Roseitalea sp.]|nr:hypothetical protein [Roseitalea sp.]MBO6952117.1 hypothetical protein [Rhizobiaceae bacterium]MBO6592037.1 hypothetical protein [Roseitalea sp.]MBO6598292.1 hypothetical protein [Roseitalea sp.]MBO6610738.1 hypothetical protein [Roseitalea sp.]
MYGIFSYFKRVINRESVSEKADIIEDLLLGRAASSDTESIKAVAQLTTALCNNQCEGVVDAGPFIFFKLKANSDQFQIFHKRLTVRERRVLNRNPTILNDPYKILEKLEGAVRLEDERATQFRSICDNDF